MNIIEPEGTGPAVLQVSGYLNSSSSGSGVWERIHPCDSNLNWVSRGYRSNGILSYREFQSFKISGVKSI